ncbi:MAG TPA: TetR/AcrR family transcriptional regulator [Propionibacteriaceae bacterium]|nr:TetR/AcrR family transcriptional regulator [Propionibacteriaceae bacterium]
MSGAERREQLIQVARGLFAQRGFEGTSVEEIAQSADVSKPVVYEHFGGKEGLYAVVVDREVQTLLNAIRAALTTPRAGSRELIERGALALLDYIDEQPDGFRILARDSSVGSGAGSFATILSDIAGRVEDLLAEPFERHGYNREFAGLYAQALVGLVAMAGQSWLDVRSPAKEEVAAHLVNLAWNGMANLEVAPTLRARDIPPRKGRRRASTTG